VTLGTERTAVQNPLNRYGEEAGWTYLPPEEALRLRRGESQAVLHDVATAQLQRLNPGTVDHGRAEDVVKRLSRVPPTIEGNLEAWEYLKGLRTVFVEAERRERNVRLLDPHNVEANVFHVTDEFVFSNGVHRIRADVAFLVNGVPVIVVETKAATHREGVAEALDQIRRYHQQGPELMALMQLHTLTHLIHFYYGATWSLSRKELFNWRDEQAGDFETLVKTFVSPRRVLRVLTEFILFTRRDEELAKVVLRPHQMRAAERVVQRAGEPHRRRGLIWHTQGSGKTYTMITVAKLLSADPLFHNPTILMLVDRNELEAQLFGNLEAVGFGNVDVAQTMQHLRQLLGRDRRGLIVSTIQKFDRMPANLNIRSNVFVLVDEAHRTTGGDLGNYLMGALPNATYIGFTGTPIDKTARGQGTFKVFGSDDPRGYLDKYSIRESIQDGTTVPLRYALAPNDLLVDRETLEREFLDLAELQGVSDVEELNRVLERAVRLKNMLKNPERVQRVAEHVARHFRETVEPMGYKAFLVGADRQACDLYKRALDARLPPEYSAVVISTAHNDPPELARHGLSEDEEVRLRRAFRKPGQLPNILIVTEKLLTGFDAPVLYCLYLDKPMRDHVLLQAIARVNRPHEDEQGHKKPCGLVVDFVGIFQKLEQALAFDSQDVEGVIEGLDVLQRRFEALIEEGQAKYLAIWADKSGDKALELVLEHFRDRERRDEFYQYFRELQELYEILSPDPFLRPFLYDYLELGRMYEVLRANYDPHLILDRSFYRKTAELVMEHTHTSVVRDGKAIYELGPQALERLAAERRPDTVKVFNLLKALRDLVAEKSGQAPYLIPIGERAEQIARAFEEGQVTTRETLNQLGELAREYREAEQAREETDLSPEGFAVLWLLKRRRVPNAEAAAREAAGAFARFPHWRRSGAQERDLRIALYTVLLHAGVEREGEVLEQMMDMLRRASR